MPLYRDELPKKSWVLGVIVEGRAKAYPIAQLPPNQSIIELVGGKEIQISYDPDSHRPGVFHSDTGDVVPSVIAYWFAWQAFYPETSLWSP